MDYIRFTVHIVKNSENGLVKGTLNRIMKLGGNIWMKIPLDQLKYIEWIEGTFKDKAFDITKTNTGWCLNYNDTDTNTTTLHQAFNSLV